MASWNRKGGKYVYVFIRENNKNKSLPRTLTKHLDGESDSNINYWLTKYLEEQGLKKAVVADFKLTQHVEDYCNFLLSRKKSPNTIAEHKRHLLNHVIPYFLNQNPPLNNPNLWDKASTKMLAALTKLGLTKSQIYRSNVALRGFYKWLSEENKILGNGSINLRNPVAEKKLVQLKATLEPKMILEYINGTKDCNHKLILILGYFFSLRPQEIFGLRVGDFRAGEKVLALECSIAMANLELFDRLAVKVNRQLTRQKLETEPKSNSSGWVACFNQDAATQLVEMIKGLSPTERLIKTSPNIVYKSWKYEFSIKDLRRASLYWLGHKTNIGQNQLMKHARHKSYETTLIYLRRPEEELGEWTELSLAE